jgi:hypothetical protein
MSTLAMREKFGKVKTEWPRAVRVGARFERMVPTTKRLSCSHSETHVTGLKAAPRGESLRAAESN